MSAFIFAMMPVLGLIVIILPFLPTLQEFFRNSDSKPLKISDHLLKDPRSNSGHVFWHFANLISVPNVADLAGKIATELPFYISKSSWVVPGGILFPPPKDASRVVSSDDLELAPHTRYLTKILSLKSIRTANASALHEIHALEDLTLNTASRVIWWASGKNVRIHDQCHLPGKTEAKMEIRMSGEVWFHLLEAPTIRSDSGSFSSLNETRETSSESESLRTVIQGDHVVKKGTNLRSTLIVRGQLLMEPGAEIYGDVKCHGDFTLDQGAKVFGNLVGKKNGTLLGGNHIGGSLLAQKNLKIGPSCQIGSQSHRVTLSALNIQISAPFQSHGVIRAWKMGHLAPTSTSPA